VWPTVDDAVVFGVADDDAVRVADGVVVALAVAVADTVLAADALAVADALVAEAFAVEDALLVELAEAGAETAGEVFTVLLARGDEEAGVLACGVGMDGKLEPGPLGVQAATATATSRAPANVVRRNFTKPPRLPGG
jgi:hypothetical protein